MRPITAALVLAFPLALPALAGEGFGFTKKAADMIVRRPPAINLAASRAQVTATSERTRISDDAQVLRKYVEDALAAGGLSLDGTPEVTVAIDLDRLETEVNTESRVEYEQEKVKDKDGKSHYVKRPKTKYYTTAKSTLAGTFKILGPRGSVFDSGDVDDSYDHTSEYWTPDEKKIEDDLLRNASRKIAARIVPTAYRVTVLLPKGSFEGAIPLAESNSWDRYLSAVEAVRPNSDPRAEAFREYAMGVGKEGLAHSTEDRSRALTLLSEAAEHYRNAAKNNPGEALFSERYTSLFNSAEAPVARAEASIALYDTWVRSAPVKEPAVVARSSKKAAGTKKSKVLRNSSIIEMKKAGLADENIILAVESATETSFDISADGLIALSKAGVSNNVIKAMQNREQ
jgi:hypothetical protein